MQDFLNKINLAAQEYKSSQHALDKAVLLDALKDFYSHLLVEKETQIQPIAVVEKMEEFFPETKIIEPEKVPVNIEPEPVYEVIKPVLENPIVAEIDSLKVAPVIKESPTSINDLITVSPQTLNEKIPFSENKRALHEVIFSKDLRSLIDLNKQFVLTQELFQGNSALFQDAIQKINNCDSIQAAFLVLKNDFAAKYNWQDTEATRLLDKLVRQKFDVE